MDKGKDKDWDAACKELLCCNPQAFIDFFEIEATYQSMCKEELQCIELNDRGDVTVGRLEMDHLILAKLVNGKEILVQTEWQTRNDLNMADRLLGYNIKAWEQYGKTLLPCVLHLARDGKIPASPLMRKTFYVKP